MSETTRPYAGSDDDLGCLVGKAGPRPDPPADELAAIRAAARETWRAAHGTAQPRGWRLGAVAAATIAVLAAAGWWWSRSATIPPAGAELAVVEAAVGVAFIGDRPADPSVRVGAGAEVRTAAADQAAPGLLALRLDEGHSVRLDRGTRIRLAPERTIELLQGRVYLDSGEAGLEEAVRVTTPFGVVREIGTRFEVGLVDDGLRVRVRDGRVEVAGERASHSAVAGDEVTVRTGGEVTRRTVESWASVWDWTQAAAPAFVLEGSELDAYLTWVESETGLTVVWEDPDRAPEAGKVRLHGSIEDLTARESLEVVLPGSGLSYRTDRGRLLLAVGPARRG